jgi:hypothetical protein
MKYTSYTVQTNFGCSGIVEFAATSESLVSEIDLPDGTKYTFTYEQTPGTPSNTTGRLASVTLPTGGTISYTYTGGSNGIECSDGSTAGLTRVTPDGTWTYARSGSGSAWTTTITDPSSAANQTVIDFQQESTNNNFYETERQVYSGSSSSGTLLKTVFTCYNASTSPCNSTAITLPISQRAAILQWPGTNALQSKLYSMFVFSNDNRRNGCIVPRRHRNSSGCSRSTSRSPRMGSYIHAVRSLTDFIGNRTMKDHFTAVKILGREIKKPGANARLQG